MKKPIIGINIMDNKKVYYSSIKDCMRHFGSRKTILRMIKTGETFAGYRLIYQEQSTNQ